MSAAINSCLSGIERDFFNRYGHIPGVSSVSGLLRGIYGAMEVAFGLMLAVTLLGEETIHQGENISIQERKPSFNYIAHGTANIGRGCVETAFVVGNVATLLYDYSGTRFSYEEEGSPSNRDIKELPTLLREFLAEQGGDSGTMLRELCTDLEDLFRAVVDLLPFSQLSAFLRVQVGIFRIGALLLPVIIQEQQKAVSSLRWRLNDLSGSFATVFGGNRRIWRPLASISLIFFRHKHQESPVAAVASEELPPEHDNFIKSKDLDDNR